MVVLGVNCLLFYLRVFPTPTTKSSIGTRSLKGPKFVVDQDVSTDESDGDKRSTFLTRNQVTIFPPNGFGDTKVGPFLVSYRFKVSVEGS